MEDPAGLTEAVRAWEREATPIAETDSPAAAPRNATG